MNIFIIIDNDFDIKYVEKILKNHNTTISIFSLTSNFLVIKKIQSKLQALETVTINMIESYKLINHEVNAMQKTIHQWSYDLGNYQIGKKNLKEWFLLPDRVGSSWWFGLMSEKNSVQDDIFFKIAQVNAIANHIANNDYDTCIIGLSDQRQKKIVKKITSSIIKNVTFIPIIIVSHRKHKKHQLFNFMSRIGVWGAIFFSAIHWIIWLKDSQSARRYLPSLKNRISKNNPMLFITYFPNIDEEAAKKGVFRNKYGLVLQDKLAELTIPVTWLVMPVFYNGHDFQSSLRLATTFCEKGEKLFILQEFFTLKIFFKSLAWWFRQLILSSILIHFVNKKKLTSKLTYDACLPMIKYLWWHSFVGASGTRGIIFYLTYLEMFKTIPQIGHCLYYCEMQAWEKALIIAKKKESPKTQTLAFQHTVVMRNYFNYFYDVHETVQAGNVTDMPLPDKLIANGKLMYTLLSESNYPNLCEAEAIRQLYLTNNKNGSVTKVNKPILLIAGSCDKVETTSLISMVYLSFPQANKFEIWFKGSPVNPVEPLFADLGINIAETNYKILYNDISELLKLATLALVANTTVAIEAVAFACPLIIPVFADTMLMNPIVDTQAEYFQVGRIEELQQFVARLIQQEKTTNVNDTQYTIQHYWNINPHIPLWTKILTSHAPN